MGKASRQGAAGLCGWGVAGLGLALGLMLLPAPAEAKLPFAPGRYVGHTSQTCPPAPQNHGACQAGQRLPISFTLTQRIIRHRRMVVVSNVQTVAVLKCEGDIKSFTHKAAYPDAWPRLRQEGATQLFGALNSLLKHGASYARDNLTGHVRGAHASGRLDSGLQIDAHGHLDSEGNWCQVRNVRWSARLQRGAVSSGAGEASGVYRRPGSGSIARPKASGPTYEDGRYVGHTNQTCPASLAGEGGCKAHERLPISFTVRKGRVSDLSALAIDRCSGGHPDYLRILRYSQPSLIYPDPTKAFFYAEQETIKRGLAAASDLIAGYLKGRKAQGALNSFLVLNEQSQLDPLGTTGCNGGIVHWHATLK